MQSCFSLQILILHLKRFSQGKYRRKKLDTFVDFPLTGLDMSPYLVDGSPQKAVPGNLYDLFAVCRHSGGLGGGHYTASVRNFKTNEWTSCNDSRVSVSAGPTNIVDASAYILFYQKSKPAESRPQVSRGDASLVSTQLRSSKI